LLHTFDRDVLGWSTIDSHTTAAAENFYDTDRALCKPVNCRRRDTVWASGVAFSCS
jgi:hypothetical protein